MATGGILSMLDAPAADHRVGDRKSQRPGLWQTIADRRNTADRARSTDVGGPAGIARTGAGNRRLILDSNEPPGSITGRVHVVLFGFLFVTVSSRITGVIGSSSNPISGMTIATLLLVCLIFVVLGWVGLNTGYRALDRRRGLHRLFQRRNNVAGFENRLPGRCHPVEAASRDLDRRTDLGIVMAGTLFGLNAAYTPAIPTRICCRRSRPLQRISRAGGWKRRKTYRVWWVLKARPGVQAGKYLVDDSLSCASTSILASAAG